MYSKSDYLDRKNKQEHLLVIATKYKINSTEYTIKSLQSKINEIKRFDIEKAITVNAFLTSKIFSYFLFWLFCGMLNEIY